MSQNGKPEKVFLIGGPGIISRGAIHDLLERGSEVAVCTRNTESKKKEWPDVRFYEADRTDAAAVKKAFDDFGAELVIDSICFQPDEAEALYEIVNGRVRHLLFISTVDAYGYPLSRIPFRAEQDEFRPPIGDYASNKRKIERFYLEKLEQEAFPVTIGRPSLSIGPRFCPMMFVDWGFQSVPRMKAGKPILVPGDGLGLMHVGWSFDVGRMAARVIGDDVAVGRHYTLSAENCITRDDYISLYTTHLGVNPERVYIPPEYIERFEGVDQMRKVHHLYRTNMAFCLDHFKRDFPDYEWLPLEQGVAEFIEENDKNGAFSDPDDENIEDRIIKEWKKRLSGW